MYTIEEKAVQLISVTYHTQSISLKHTNKYVREYTLTADIAINIQNLTT